MSIKCITCDVLLKSEKCMQTHRKSKRHIDKVNNIIAQPINFTCGCGKNYSYRQGLYVHRRTCTAEIPEKSKQKPIKVRLTDSVRIAQLEDNLYEERKLREQFQKESDELRLQISLLLDKNTTQINTTNNNSNNRKTSIGTQQNITININAFGNENTDYIDDKAMIECIGRVYKSIPSLLEKIHFDPKHPENHNIKITNRKLPYASVMGNNQKWKTVDRKDAIDTMVNNSYNMLDDKFKENKDKISESKQEHFRGFQSRFDREDKELMKELKFEVDTMVLNGVL